MIIKGGETANHDGVSGPIYSKGELAMLIRMESYCVTTLCKVDIEAVEKTKKLVDQIRLEIVKNAPECKHVKVTRKSCVRTELHAGNRKIDVYRLTWKVYGEKDIVEKFFDVWKDEADRTLNCFRVHRDYSLCELCKNL